MSELKQTPFSFTQFHVDEFSIKREPVPEEGTPEFTFHPSGYIDEENKSFLLTLSLSVKDSNNAYEINCNCIGYFIFGTEDELMLSNFFYVNAPAIMFPYIRSFIAGVTALSGLPAINIPLVNMPKKIGEDLKEHTVKSSDYNPDE